MLELYCLDTETTGLDHLKNDVIELSIIRLSTNEQRTWCLKPLNFEAIHPDALRINGHKLEDLKGVTGNQGFRNHYLSPSNVLVEVENWLMEDGVTSSDRICVGQNVSFDKSMLESLWNKCNSSGTYPFNKKYSLDTMQIELVMNYCANPLTEISGYSLKALTKKYGVVNSKAHSAAADTQATKEVFLKQMEYLKSKLGA